MKSRTGSRDRDIFAARQAGQSMEEIGAHYRLSAERVRVILIAERNRRLFSIEQHYCEVRRKKNHPYGNDLAATTA